MTRRQVPPPPEEPTGGRSCDAGGCNAPSIGWRYFPQPLPGEWLPVCIRDMRVKGVPRLFRVHDSQYELEV